MKSLHFKLFWRYAILILSIITVFMAVLYQIWGNTLRNNAASELLADCDNISTLLDTQIEQMDDVSKRIVNSRQIKSLFVEDLYSSVPDAYYNRRTFSNTLFDIIRLSFDHMELNMFDASNRHIHIGITSTFQKQEDNLFSVIPRTSRVLDAYGKKVILSTRYPELNTTEEPVISLCRAFAPHNPTKETAILELQLRYPYLSQKIDDAIHNQKDKKKIFVYDQSGSLIYPYDEAISTQTETYISKALQTPDQTMEELDSAKNAKRTGSFAQRTSAATNWTVFVAESEKDLFLSFYQFRTLIFGATILVLILTLFITNQIATRLSTPIQKLEQKARTLTLDNLDAIQFDDCENSFQELTSLSRSFDQMKTNLQNSLEDVVSAHTMAVDSQMLALQSQMNPHFLYNTLASISILAEDGESDKIVKTCEDLSLLLRYISSGSGRTVALWQEIEHTHSYINLIKIKYEERIQFHLDIDSALLQITVPKLVVQPLVENCVKYGLEVPPPWVITIRGFIENACWVIQVQDNGSGFSHKYLDTFYQKTAEIHPENPLSDLSINGMGLLNLYIRLRLLYKDRMIFKLENLTEGGARVTVGGPLPKTIGVIAMSRKSINVLVVEDEILLSRNIKKKILSVSEDFQIIGEAFNGKEALEIIETNRPDIVFTDIRMPIMDGLELARILREKYPEIYVIIVSGYDDFEYARTAIRYQVHDYLLKPLKMEPLTKLLDSLKATIERDSVQIQSQVFFSSETPIILPESMEPAASDMMCWSTLNTSATPEIDAVIKEMDAYIRLHYRESINISQLAEKYHFNHSYMTRIFKKQMGQSPLKLINELRINDAKMLTDSPLSIREISEQLGFTDQHYFSRIFKDFTGMTPKDFRERKNIL